MKGLHLTGDLSGCPAPRLLDMDATQMFCVLTVREVGLSVMQDVFHRFGEGLGFTGVVLLAESHVAVHTWPELGRVTLDVYVCNHTRNNREAAQQLFDALVKYFQSNQLEQHTIERGQTTLCESITPCVAQQLLHCDLIEQGRTQHQQYAVYQHPSFGKVLTLDGVCMLSEQDEFIYHEMLTHLPCCSIEQPRKALIIGGGDGGCAEELLKHPSIECMDWVEIDAGVVSVARRHFSSIHRDSFDDPKVQLHILDGAQFVAQAVTLGLSYDLMLLDLTDPQGLAVDLYRPEFFVQCANILSPKGVLVMHLGAPFFHADRVNQLLADLSEAFQIVRPYGVSVPLYGAYWGFAAASQLTDPMSLGQAQVHDRIAARQLLDLRCYSAEFHFGAMKLPQYFSKLNPHWKAGKVLAP